MAGPSTAGLEIQTQARSPGLIGRTYTLCVALPLPLGISRSCSSRQEEPDCGQVNS